MELGPKKRNEKYHHTQRNGRYEIDLDNPATLREGFVLAEQVEDAGDEGRRYEYKS